MRSNTTSDGRESTGIMRVSCSRLMLESSVSQVRFDLGVESAICMQNRVGESPRSVKARFSNVSGDASGLASLGGSP